ncbi:unnamed protein product [Rhizophagus irregularis]|uniref:Autophagy-related protein n=1 Tax=Rhizophagus irregularis TaxID=588596 RepID=A0A2I1GVR6_9GLOM|nr:MFS general substrate transporter [Rhizophagus irregularis]CAB4429180.1 unnamed protein product [Rhizophagus irregularis]
MSQESPHDSQVIKNEPLTSKELKGWYAYYFASGAYDNATIGLFIPIVLENLASQAGYEVDKLDTPCDITKSIHTCVVKFGVGYVDTASYSLYIIALTAFLQCILLISSSPFADHGANRKNFLLTYSYIGAISTSLFSLIIKAGGPFDSYVIAGILTIVSNCCFGAAFVFYLSYIPIYSRIHTDVISQKKTEDKVATELSINMMTAGFIAGLLSIIGGLGIVTGLNESNSSIQYAVSLGGIWWFVWLTIPLFLLKKHPRPPLPSTENLFLYPYKRIFKTLKSARKLWQTMKFLIAWSLISDGINIIGPLSALFIKVELGLSDQKLVILAIIVPITAVIGDYLFHSIEKYYGFSIKAMVLINSVILSLLPTYTLVGFIAPFGLRQQWEVWLFVSYFGLSLGSIQAYYQAMFSILIPKGHESEFFSLFLITAKGSSWMGPLITGAITNVTHNIRSGFLFIIFMLLVSCIIMWTVDVEKGKHDAEDFINNEMEENTENTE